MIVLPTPEPTVRPPSRNHFTVLFTILSLIFLVFQRFCLLKACGILVVFILGAKMEPETLLPLYQFENFTFFVIPLVYILNLIVLLIIKFFNIRQVTIYVGQISFTFN